MATRKRRTRVVLDFTASALVVLSKVPFIETPISPRFPDTRTLQNLYIRPMRPVELVTLRWDAVDFTHGQIHVSRAKNGSASVHPLSGLELRALRRPSASRRRPRPSSSRCFDHHQLARQRMGSAGALVTKASRPRATACCGAASTI